MYRCQLENYPICVPRRLLDKDSSPLLPRSRLNLLVAVARLTLPHLNHAIPARPQEGIIIIIIIIMALVRLPGFVTAVYKLPHWVDYVEKRRLVASFVCQADLGMCVCVCVCVFMRGQGDGIKLEYSVEKPLNREPEAAQLVER